MENNGNDGRFKLIHRPGIAGLASSISVFLVFILFSAAAVEAFIPGQDGVSGILRSAVSGIGFSSRNEEAAEYREWSDIIAEVNPALTKEQVCEIGKAVARYSAAYNLSPRLVMAVMIVESHGDIRAVSPMGAVGLMQVMPWWKDELRIAGDLYAIDANIMAGCFILSDNIKRWGYKEGILRYYRGSKKTDEGYFGKVQKTLESLYV